MPMIFASEKARKHLLEKGFVWTFRTHKRKLQALGGPVPRQLSNDWATDHRCGKKLCNVSIQNELEITRWNQLERFVCGSGFNSLDDWVNEIITLNGGLERYATLRLETGHLNPIGWLYLVSKR